MPVASDEQDMRSPTNFSCTGPTQHESKDAFVARASGEFLPTPLADIVGGYADDGSLFACQQMKSLQQFDHQSCMFVTSFAAVSSSYRTLACPASRFVLSRLAKSTLMA